MGGRVIEPDGLTDEQESRYRKLSRACAQYKEQATEMV